MIVVEKLNKLITQHSAIRFFMVGVTAFVVDYLLLMICYYILSLPLTIATTIGFFSGFLVSFLSNRYWVFAHQNQTKYVWLQVVGYFVLLGFNYMFTLFMVHFLNDQGVAPYISKVAIIMLVMCWNYALFRWVIFADRPPKAGGDKIPN